MQWPVIIIMETINVMLDKRDIVRTEKEREKGTVVKDNGDSPASATVNGCLYKYPHFAHSSAFACVIPLRRRTFQGGVGRGKKISW